MAAAYAALVSLINDLELIPNHPLHSFSFDNKQISSLSQIVHFLIDFMESYDSHGFSREAAGVLESRIASVAQAAHDVVESHVVDQIHAGTTLLRKPRSYFLLNLQKAIDNMNFVKRKAMQFEGKGGKKAEQRIYSPSTSSEPQSFRKKKNRMVGFDAVADRLMEMLVGEPSSQLVIPIVGMGGMGKTTLAKNTYEHSLIVPHFDVRYWATVSQEYSAVSILTELVFGVRNSTSGATVDELGNKLHKYLWGKRYLIILDDVWSLEAWDEIHMYLPNNGKGSRVIVTTRLCYLATNLRFSPFKMEFLDEDQSWKLFCEKVFDEEECPVELVKIGKKIVRKCQGLPLSIVVIGGHLRKSSREIVWWAKIANLMNPISSSEEGEKCMKVISLSYEHLPICVKPCFLYMGKFGEDRRIDVSYQLVKVWVAEGFVRAKDGVSLEEVAEAYLNDLIDRNLVIVRERRWNGKPKYCGLHDMVREFCMKASKKDNLLCVVDSSEGLSRERRIVILKGKQESEVVNALKSAPLLRSLESYYHGELPLESAKLLRVLEGGCSPPADFQLLNLRYHAIRSFYGKCVIESLAWSSISLFWNLQTLNVYGLTIETLQIWEMTQLRHLQVDQFYLPDPPPSDVQKCVVLRNLQTLSRVKNLRLTEEVCKRMPNIKHLQVSYNLKDCSDYYLYNLGHFTKLESAHLWGAHDFVFPSSLQELHLTDHKLHWGDVGVIIESLPHLGFLSLGFVQGGTWSLAEVEFPCLKSLELKDSYDFIYWSAQSSHFPALVTLRLSYLRQLSEIPFEIGDIPTLAHIELDHCSVSAVVSAMRILVEQHSFENHDLHLDVRFYEMEQADEFLKMVQEEDLQSINNLRLFCKGEKIKAY